MAARKHTAARKASGRSLTEDERTTTRINLRLDADATAALARLVRRWGCDRSPAIARALLEALARRLDSDG